jgi:hypothetical protein
MARNSPLLNFPQRFNMKIVDFKRDEAGSIFVVAADGTEIGIDFAYVAKHKPQIGDEYPAAEAVEEVVVEEPAADAA